MNWLLYLCGILSGVVLTLALQAWFVSWLFSPVDRTERISKDWYR